MMLKVIIKKLSLKYSRIQEFNIMKNLNLLYFIH